MTKVKLMLIISAALVALIGWSYLQNLRADNIRLARETAALTQENRALKNQAAISLTALAAREAERQKLQAESEKMRQTLEDLYEKNETARHWADTVCSADVIECLLR